MEKRAMLKLYHIQHIDNFISLAKRSHGPVCLMDGDREICDLREESQAIETLRVLGHEGELPEVDLSIPASDMPMYLNFMISNAA